MQKALEWIPSTGEGVEKMTSLELSKVVYPCNPSTQVVKAEETQ